MSIENNPAIEVLNTVVTTKSGDPFVFVVTFLLAALCLICVIAFIVDWFQTGRTTDGFWLLLGLTVLFGAISGFNLYTMKHSGEVVSYEVRFTDPDHFSLTDYEKLQENYEVVSINGKIYTLKERIDKDD
mgnify:CR=1 FL=1